MVRRRVIRRRPGKRRGVSLPSLSRSLGDGSRVSRSAMLKMWNSLSSEERDRRRKLLVSKYYGGDFEAFQRDVEKRPFRVLSALLALGAEARKPFKPEKAKKPKPRPKTKAKPKAEKPKAEKPKAEEPKPRVERPAKPETRKPLTEEAVLEELNRLHAEKGFNTYYETLRERLYAKGYDTSGLGRLISKLKESGDVQVTTDARVWSKDYLEQRLKKRVDDLKREVEAIIEGFEKEFESVRSKFYEPVVEIGTDLEEEFKEWELKPSPEKIEELRSKISELASRIKDAEKALEELDERGRNLFKTALDIGSTDLARRLRTTVINPIATSLKNLDIYKDRVKYMSGRLRTLEAELKPPEKGPKPVTEEAVLSVFREYIKGPLQGMTLRTVADFLEKQGYDTRNVYSVLSRLIDKGEIVRVGKLGLGYVYSLADKTPTLEESEMAPEFYEKFHVFKVDSRVADQVLKELKQIAPPDERFKEFFDLEVYEDKRPRVTEIYVNPRQPIVSGMDPKVRNYIENQARLMGRKVFEIMKKYGARVEDEDDKFVPVEEYEERKLKEGGAGEWEAGEESIPSSLAGPLVTSPESPKKPLTSEDLVSVVKELTLKTKGKGASFQEIEEELKKRGFETTYLSNVFRKEPRVIPDWEGRYFAVEPGMFDYGKLKDHELELVKRRFERAASEIRERREEFKAEAKKIEEELERRRMEYESWKERLVEKAKAGTLTYAETPEDNPFKLVWHPEKEEDWDELRKHE
ncbi:hypothetical protein DRO57_08825, partial [Candidatus Bathyarchaeota archaeon]